MRSGFVGVRRGMAHARVASSLVVLVAGVALGQEPGSDNEARAQIRDMAGIFGPEAVREARADLESISRRSGQPILIETVDSLDGQKIDEASLKRAEVSGGKGVYVLISEGDRKLRVRDYQSFLGHDRRTAITEAFTRHLMAEDRDAALKAGVEAIGLALADHRPASGTGDATGEAETRPQIHLRRLASPPASRPESTPDEPPLIQRNQSRMTQGGARRILEAAEAKATAMGLKVNIAIVDDGGHLLAFARMDGGRPASAYTAITKATSAATFRQPTGPLPPGTTEPDPLHNLSIQNAAAVSGGKVTTLFGGVPIVVDDQVIGGVGVGGGTGQQDAEIARAGIDALLSALGGTPPAAK